ncbi:PucR family transcriptional regulator [Lysinibacillus sp. 38-6]|uniref:PucR family transcriptional regulator n=1 Tax=Lysinibacillus sp. 38-6 TaxID=3385991 RepID=UPI00390894F6
MLDKLEKFFHAAFTTTYNAKDHTRYWFTTEDGTKFGILKSALSDVELNLLTTLFRPIENQSNSQHQSTIQQKWFEFLFNDAKELPFLQDIKLLRFFYFYLKQPIDDLNNFKEAITGVIGQPVILMIDERQGIIIDEKPQIMFDKESFDQLSNTLMSDFFVQIYSYIGQLHPADQFVKDKFHFEFQCFKAIHRYAKRENSMTFYEAFPLLLIDSPTYVNKDILSNLLIDSMHAQEMLQTIQVFLQCNLNASLTAKKLYIHRNSLQYRLDKFIENTGIDIRSFTNAAFVSLAMLLLKSENY